MVSQYSREVSGVHRRRPALNQRSDLLLVRSHIYLCLIGAVRGITGYDSSRAPNSSRLLTREAESGGLMGLGISCGRSRSS